MKSMYKFLSFAAILTVAASSAAYADPVESFNSSLTQGPTTQKVYFGNTTANSGFTVLTGTNSVTGGTLQLGLEAITRFQGPITPDTNDYTYAPGTGTPGDATWDFEFSVNTGSDPLSEYTYNITIHDVTTGKSATFDPTALPDNGQANGANVFCSGCAYVATNDGFQNAENLGFSFLSTQLGGFNPNAADTYQITLSATSVDGVDPGVTINVLPPLVTPPAVPEPSSFVLLGTGLIGGIGSMIRRRRIA
jgi:hypothetical protein